MLVAFDSDHFSPARLVLQRELEFLMAGGGHGLHVVQPRPPHYDIVKGGNVDYQEVDLLGGPSYLDSEGDFTLRVY